MPIVPQTYSDALYQIDELTGRMSSAKSRMTRGLELLLESVTIYQTLDEASPTGFLDLVQFINAQAAANPTDEDWISIKSQKDKIVANFQSDLVTAQAKLTAANAA